MEGKKRKIYLLKYLHTLHFPQSVLDLFRVHKFHRVGHDEFYYGGRLDHWLCGFGYLCDWRKSLIYLGLEKVKILVPAKAFP